MCRPVPGRREGRSRPELIPAGRLGTPGRESGAETAGGGEALKPTCGALPSHVGAQRWSVGLLGNLPPVGGEARIRPPRAAALALTASGGTRHFGPRDPPTAVRFRAAGVGPIVTVPPATHRDRRRRFPVRGSQVSPAFGRAYDEAPAGQPDSLAHQNAAASRESHRYSVAAAPGPEPDA